MSYIGEGEGHQIGPFKIAGNMFILSFVLKIAWENILINYLGEFHYQQGRPLLCEAIRSNDQSYWIKFRLSRSISL